MALVAAVLDKVDELCSTGLSLLNSLRVEEAMTYFSRAIYLQPNVAVFHAYRGDCCLALCDLMGAIAAYRKALRLTPPDGASQPPSGGARQPSLSQRAVLAERFTRLLLCLARLHIAEGALPAAQAVLAEAQALAPWDATLWVYRVSCFLAQREWRSAAAQLGAVIEEADVDAVTAALAAAKAEMAADPAAAVSTPLPPPSDPELLGALGLAIVPAAALPPVLTRAAVQGVYGPPPPEPWVWMPPPPAPTQAAFSPSACAPTFAVARAVPLVACSWAAPQTTTEAVRGSAEWLTHPFAAHLSRWLLLAALPVPLASAGTAAGPGAAGGSGYGGFNDGDAGGYGEAGDGTGTGSGGVPVMMLPVPLLLEALLLRARTRLALDELTLARDDLALAHAAMPTLPEVAALAGALSSAAGSLALRARAHLLTRTPEAAIRDLTHALALCPRDIRLLHLRATARRQMDDLPGALDDLHAALALFSEARAADEARFRAAVAAYAEERARRALTRGTGAGAGSTFLTCIDADDGEQLPEAPNPALFSSVPADVLPAIQQLLAASLVAMADGLRARVQPTTAMPSIPTVAGVSAGRRGRATPPPSAAAATAMRLKGSRTAPSKLAGSQSTALMTTVPSRTVMALPAQAAALGVVAATASIEAPVTWTAVLTLYSRAVELEPQNAAHWARRGDAYADSGSLELALADYEQSAICEREASFAPSVVRPRDHAGGPGAAANRTWTPSAGLRARLARVRGEVARALFNAGRLPEAEAELTRALAVAPGFAALYLQRSAVRERLTMLVGAIKDAQAAASLAPDDVTARQRLSALSAKYGKAA